MPPPDLDPGELDDPWAATPAPPPISTSPVEDGWAPTTSALDSLRSSPAISSPLSPSGSGLRSRETTHSTRASGSSTRPPASPSILSPNPRSRSASLLGSLRQPSRSGSQSVNLEELRDVDPDVSRPSLKRLTSETERQLWEDSTVSSRGGSFDRERDREEEVEVIVHSLMPSDSLAGLALKYGIDISTLRKVNKLWPSDPVHVRTELYVPLESCRPTSGKLVRTGTTWCLVPNAKPSSRPRSPKRANGDAMSVLSDSTARGSVSPDPELPERQEVLLAEGEDPLTSSTPPAAPPGIPLHVIKLPASRLHLYPSSRRKGRASTGGARVSMDSDASGLSGLSGGLTSLSLNDAAGSRRPSVAKEKEDEGRFFGLLSSSRSESGLASGSRHDGRFAPLMPRVDGFGPDDEPDTFGSRKAKRVVKLRPPTAHTPHKSSGVVGKISDFFNIPPPPVDPPQRRPRGPAARAVSEPLSREGSGSSSPVTTEARGGLEVDVELSAQRRRPKTDKKTD